MISSFFTADYRDGRVIFGGKHYPAGMFAVHLLNQFYINDTAARIAVFRDGLNFHILQQLQDGYAVYKAKKPLKQAIMIIPTISARLI